MGASPRYNEDFSTLIFGRRLGVIRSGCWYQKPWESPAPSPAKPCSKPYQPRLISILNIQTHTGRKHFLIDRLSEDGHIGRKPKALRAMFAEKNQRLRTGVKAFSPSQSKSKQEASISVGSIIIATGSMADSKYDEGCQRRGKYIFCLPQRCLPRRLGNTEYFKYQDCLNPGLPTLKRR